MIYLCVDSLGTKQDQSPMYLLVPLNYYWNFSLGELLLSEMPPMCCSSALCRAQFGYHTSHLQT